MAEEVKFKARVTPLSVLSRLLGAALVAACVAGGVYLLDPVINQGHRMLATPWDALYLWCILWIMDCVGSRQHPGAFYHAFGSVEVGKDELVVRGMQGLKLRQAIRWDEITGIRTLRGLWSKRLWLIRVRVGKRKLYLPRSVNWADRLVAEIAERAGLAIGGESPLTEEYVRASGAGLAIGDESAPTEEHIRGSGAGQGEQLRFMAKPSFLPSGWAFLLITVLGGLPIYGFVVFDRMATSEQAGSGPGLAIAAAAACLVVWAVWLIRVFRNYEAARGGLPFAYGFVMLRPEGLALEGPMYERSLGWGEITKVDVWTMKSGRPSWVIVHAGERSLSLPRSVEGADKIVAGIVKRAGLALGKHTSSLDRYDRAGGAEIGQESR